MARQPRTDIGNYPYHILNRSNARLPIFFTSVDYVLFLSVLPDAIERSGMRLLAYYLSFMNTTISSAELEEIRNCINKEKLFGSDTWKEETVRRYTIPVRRDRGGRPKNGT